MDLGPQTRLAVPSHIVTRLLDDTLAILDTNSGAYYTVNEVGGRLLELSRQGATLQDVANAVADEFEVTADEALGDLIELAGDLLEAGLVTLSD